MDKTEEKAIFDKATEKLDLYVPLCLKDNYVDYAREFLQPGGEYVRFALKEFMKELLFELIRPVGEWTKDPYYIDMAPIYETVKRELAEHFEVRHGLEGYIFSEFVYVKINDILSFMLLRGHHAFSIVGIRVDGFDDDDDSDWMGYVAEKTGDELLECQANGDCEQCSAYFFPDQTTEFCRVAEYVYDNIDRFMEMAEEKAREERLFYEKLDLYEKIVGRSAAKYGAEGEREYLNPDGGFVKNCMTSFVKGLVYSQNGLYHDSELWEDDGYEVDLDKAYEEISSRLSPKINVVREAYEFYYSENITVEVTGDIHLILVREAPLKILRIWVNKVDSEHEHGKWLAPDRLCEFCDMVGHICDIYGKYEQLALQRAAALREKLGL